MGLVYAPAVAVVGQYFHRKRPIAMSIASSGSALGGILFPVIVDRMLNHSSLGFPWTQRVVVSSSIHVLAWCCWCMKIDTLTKAIGKQGFIILGFVVVACLTIKPGVQPRKGTYFLWHAFKQPAYTLQIAGLFAIWWGLFIPFFFLPSYAEHFGMSTSLAWYLVTILNAGSLFGRLIGGVLGMVIGPFNWLAFCSAACSLLILCWLRMTSTVSLIFMALLFGFFSGGIISLMIVTMAHTATSPKEIGTYIGQGAALVSFSALTGSPIAGALVERYGGYTQAIIFSGVCSMAGFVFLLAARFSFAKGRGVVV
jgi:MFS family permease